MTWLAVFSLILIPLCSVAIDGMAAVRANWTRPHRFYAECADFTVLVPIWGNIEFLQNVDYLADYGHQVILCTTGDESAEFERDLLDLAALHGFRVYLDAPRSEGGNTHTAARATSGTTRDRLIRNVLAQVDTRFVVPLDADTTTPRPIDELVGEFEASGADLSSIRLVTTTQTTTLFTQLQHLEYRLAMQLRLIAPWMVSGACHVARTEVLADVMQRHSLFFQGNDVEVGVIASSRGYDVQHIPFEVTTIVPSMAHSWWRQRLAWTGGEFRLFMVNFAIFGRRHPFLWFYGAIVVLAAYPLRWLALVDGRHLTLIIAAVMYCALSLYLHFRTRSPLAMVVPFYALFVALVMPPLGAYSYVRMGLTHGNWGLIRPNRVHPV